MNHEQYEHVKRAVLEAIRLPAEERRAHLMRTLSDSMLNEAQALLEQYSTQDALDAQQDDSDPAQDHPEKIGDYHILEVLGEGGMGTVYLAQQTQPIRRQVALKVIKLGMDTKAIVGRFQSERQALALMDHTHVARVLDAGSTSEGRPYFVMEHVKGEPLTVYCDRLCLTLKERLRLFAAVCDGVQHAHQKGIIHRDIKPSNVLVTLESDQPVPRIIDFGLAKAIEQELTEQSVHTAQGQLLGTLEYMSPEQVGMSCADIDTRTDVYSLGVMLYQLLVGVLPFESERLRCADLGTIQRIICEEEPALPSTRVSSLGQKASVTHARMRHTNPYEHQKQLRGDLDWITLKTLDKDRNLRYGSAAELAADVHRHLLHEPVSAGRPSAGYRARKFLRRNRGTVTAGTAVVVALGAGLIVSTSQYLRAEIALEKAVELADAEGAARAQADSARAESDARYEEIVQLSDIKLLEQAEAAAAGLWPAHPENLQLLQTWLCEQAWPLRERLTVHRKSLQALRSRALPYTAEQREADRAGHPQAGALAAARQELSALAKQLAEVSGSITAQSPGPEQQHSPAHQAPAVGADAPFARIQELEQAIISKRELVEDLNAAVSSQRTWQFAVTAEQWRHEVLENLVKRIERFVDPDPALGTLVSVEQRLQFARTVEDRTMTGAEAAVAWEQAASDIAALPVYNGYDLKPQLGLLPLRRDPNSGLWEFWHVQSGIRPQPNSEADDANPWQVTGETALIFVLIPGGTFKMGAQKDNPEAPNYDPEALADEQPVHEITLDSYFISKYEMTQGQWRRFTGSNPSHYGSTFSVAGLHANTAWNPVEKVSWTECQQALQRLDLALPTEAQWEYAARGGQNTPWWCGADKECIGAARAGNIADGRSKRLGAPANWSYEEWLSDDWLVHAPVGSFRPNPFGLHDTIGNVWEWCRDWHGRYIYEAAEGDGERLVEKTGDHVQRGGAFTNAATFGRVTIRNSYSPDSRYPFLGVRPARPCN